MRHGKKINHLGRKSAHRKAMLANMACSLIEHKRIKTTVAKAKALRVYIEPLITKSKDDTTHSRRVVFSQLKNKEAVKELFGEVSVRVADRPGGYTRILKIGNRLGDNAEMAVIELVDYNELAPGKASTSSASKKSRRRRSGKKKSAASETAKVAKKEEVVEETVAETVEEVVDAKPEVEAVEAAAPEVVEAPAEEESPKEEKKAEQKTAESPTDDLKKIEGVGPKIASILAEAGIGSFEVLAGTDPEKIKEILAEAGNRYKSHDPTTWPEQAALAAAGEWDKLKELQDKLDGGKATK